MKENIQFINDDVLNQLKQYKEFEYHTLFTDPPYNLGSKIYIDPFDGKPKFKGIAKDFMSKWSFGHEQWESFSIESYRVLKYGGYCILFGLDRQLSLIQYYMVKAGFEEMQSMYWYSIQGFPKAVDISKQIDKRLNDSDLSKQFEGYKYSQAPLKQTVETILIFRKPPKYKSVLNDVMEFQNDNEISPSVLNIKDNTIPTDIESTSGRFPANTFVDDFTSEILDTQSGELTSGYLDPEKHKRNKTSGQYKSENGCYGTFNNGDKVASSTYGDTGGCSRILHKCNYEEIDFDLYQYCSKVSNWERGFGCDNIRNNHPTLKPIKLIEQILRLFKLPIVNQRLLIPFSGVGSEVIGAYRAGFNDITAIELSNDYHVISKHRFDKWKPYKHTEFKKIKTTKQTIQKRNNFFNYEKE